MSVESIFAYTIPDNGRVKLILEDRFLHLDYAQSSSGTVAPPAGCMSSISCVTPSSLSSARKPSILYFNILWAEIGSASMPNYRPTLTIDYCSTTEKKTAELQKLRFLIDESSVETCSDWIQKLLQRAYDASAGVVRSKRLLILINPFSGQGKARNLFNSQALPILDAARCKLEEVETKYKGHAAEIVASMENLEERYDAIVCCSGDGIPHEVFNGLSRRSDVAKAFSVPVCQLPCGSGNALCMNLVGCKNVPFASLCVVKGAPQRMDLCSITQDGKRHMTFLSQTLGMIADCDIGTEHLRWMGEARFTVGIISRVFKKAKYPCKISVRIAHESRSQVRQAYHENKLVPQESLPAPEGLPPLKFGTVEDEVPEDWKEIDTDSLAILYVGQMPWMSSDTMFFPAALPRDGFMDMVIIDGNIPILESLKILTSVEGGKHFDSKHVHYYKVDAYRVIPKAKSGYISIDGEKFNFSPFQVEVHQGLATVLAHHSSFQAPEV
ncbi:sphingosine kinase [Myxozyma melibiosi]|uniref:Sphingosine kinase n=1 Tax=Myxozyma melibiosi TaxID=54550 RepID=A0ABR1F3M6_9ASCO